MGMPSPYPNRLQSVAHAQVQVQGTGYRVQADVSHLPSIDVITHGGVHPLLRHRELLVERDLLRTPLGEGLHTGAGTGGGAVRY